MRALSSHVAVKGGLRGSAEEAKLLVTVRVDTIDRVHRHQHVQFDKQQAASTLPFTSFLTLCDFYTAPFTVMGAISYGGYGAVTALSVIGLCTQIPPRRAHLQV